MPKLKLQYFGHLMQRTESFEKTLMLGKIKGRRRRGRQRMRWLDTSLTQRMWVWANSKSWWWTGKPGVLQSMRLHRVGHDGVTELNWQSNYSSCHFHWIAEDREAMKTIICEGQRANEWWSQFSSRFCVLSLNYVFSTSHTVYIRLVWVFVKMSLKNHLSWVLRGG